MEFKEYLLLKEAEEELTTGMRNKRGSEDDYDPEGDSVFKGLKFDPKNHAKLINTLTPKFEKYFKDLSVGQRQDTRATPAIKKLKLDQSAGARSLAILFARVLHDVITAKEGPKSLYDMTSGYQFASRMKSLGETNVLYPILFLIGRNVLMGKTYDRTGSRVMVNSLADVLDELGVEGETAYKLMKKFDQSVKTQPESKTWVNKYMWKSVQDILKTYQDEKALTSDVLYMTKDEYDKLYFPDASKGEADQSKWSMLKRDMFDKYKEAEAKAKETNKPNFIRTSETDEAVRAYAEYVYAMEYEEAAKDFADAVIIASKGEEINMPGDVLSKLYDLYPSVGEYMKKKMKIKDYDDTVKTRDTEASSNLRKIKAQSTVSADAERATDDEVSTFVDKFDEIKDIADFKSHLANTSLVGKVITPAQDSAIQSAINKIIGREPRIKGLTANSAAIKKLWRQVKTMSGESKSYNSYLEVFGQ